MPDQPTHYIKNLDVEYISLVNAGANKKELIYKSKVRKGEGREDFERQIKIAKTDEDKRLVYCIVYSPQETDAHGHAMKKADIEKAAHGFLFEGRTDQVDKQHNEEPGDGRVVESYIIGKNDETFPGDPAGSWAVAIKVTSEDTWQEVKEGDIGGVSLQGICSFEENTGATKSMFQSIMKALKGVSPVKKDFNQRLMGRQITQAVYAFEDEVRNIGNDEQIEDKKAAVLSAIDDFRSYVDNMDVQTKSQFKPTRKSMSQEDSEKNEARSEKQEAGGKTAEVVVKALNKQLEPLQQTIEKQAEKLEGLEKRLGEVEDISSPGSRTLKGQDQDEEEKTYKGIGFLGSGPSN